MRERDRVAAGNCRRSVSPNAAAVKTVLPLVFLALCAAVPAQDTPPKAGTPADLAAPLRRFDRNKNGVLDEPELKEARQTHNRGGRAAQPDAGQWKEQLQRRERQFSGSHQREFDADGDGKLNDAEKKALEEVWQQVAKEFTALRTQMVEKYDRNDDGELNDQERNASRQENDRLRREIEERCIREWQAKKQAPAGA